MSKQTAMSIVGGMFAIIVFTAMSLQTAKISKFLTDPNLLSSFFRETYNSFLMGFNLLKLIN
jgi:hypothetical protein